MIVEIEVGCVTAKPNASILLMVRYAIANAPDNFSSIQAGRTNIRVHQRLSAVQNQKLYELCFRY
jgi:hypothetical protein